MAHPSIHSPQLTAFDYVHPSSHFTDEGNLAWRWETAQAFSETEATVNRVAQIFLVDSSASQETHKAMYLVKILVHF